MRSERLAAATGAIYVVVIMVGSGIATGDQSNVQSGQAVLHDLQHRTSTQHVGIAMEVLSFAALILFTGYLYGRLRRGEGPEGWAAPAAFGAGLLATAIKLGTASAMVAATLRAHELTPDLARTLDDIGGGGFVVSGFAYGIFISLAAWSAFGSRVLPRWLSIGGLVVGVLTVAAGTAGVLDPAGYMPVPFLLCLAWLLIASIIWTVRPARPVTRTAERAADAVAAEVAASA